MIYFTSDLHLGHENILRFANRPFDSVKEMNRILIANYNALVREEDTVYILGDLTYRIPLTEAETLIAKLNGRKHLIKGNHDKNYDKSLFEEVVDYKQIHEYCRHFTLMHYPMLEWAKMRCGSIMLHGHMHNIGIDYNMECKKNNILRYDVGVDANNFYCSRSLKTPRKTIFTRDFMGHHGKCGDMVILSGNFFGIIRTYMG